MNTQANERGSLLTITLEAIIEQSLQPENQQIKPVASATSVSDYRKMLDVLDRNQVAREVRASFSLY